ncbi:hypothetical protein HanLR1_Chr09g0320421 [Helianthus annuus]|nr:hypothetical protein HanLR1_Chr09g0320421 [Helianthus annuus]
MLSSRLTPWTLLKPFLEKENIIKYYWKYILFNFIFISKPQETLHIHKKAELESASDVRVAQDEEKDSTLLSLLKNWPLMSSIIVYCVFSLHDTAYTEVDFKIWSLVTNSLLVTNPKKFLSFFQSTESLLDTINHKIYTINHIV